MSAPEPFVTYTRTKVETKHVAEVTEANISQIAALIRGKVDYSSGEPELIVPGTTSWRVKVGWTVALIGDRLQNMNGFNSNGEWSDS